jgi:HK97 family phage prohead protease
MAIPFKVSDESLNSYGFWVKTDGIDLSGFTGVMLYDHDRNGKLPIGTWENTRNENGALLTDANFDQDDEFAKSVMAKVQKGIIKGASIGLNVIEFSNDPKLMKPGQKRPTVTKCSLEEISVTPFPSNKNALRLMVDGKALNLSENNSEIENILPLINNNVQMKQVALKLGLPETATEQEVVDAVTALEAKAAGLQTSLNAAFMKLGEVTGVINDSNRERMTKLAKTDFELALSFMDASTSSAHSAESKAKSEKKEEKSENTLRLSDLIKDLKGTGNNEPEKDYDWYQKNDPVTLSEMRTKEPDKFTKLFEKFYGTTKTE